MTTQEFKRNLVGTLMQQMSQRLIELADESISEGVEEYIEKGYITLDFKGEYGTSAKSEEMRKELLSKGLEYYDFRCIYDTAWGKLTDHLRGNGWEFELVENSDGDYDRIVKMPSKLSSE